MAEHKRVVKSKDPLNGIVVHVQKTAHNINWHKLGSFENIWGERRVLEALEIQQRRPTMNLDAGLLLDRLWTPLFIQAVEVTRPEVSWREAQTLFKEGSSQGTPTAEDDPQG